MSSQIAQVKDAIDIVALISEKVKLTKAGKNYKGLCPFHSEKSPSFFVTPELGRYKCFGCGESGDAFTYLQKTENLSFAESLRELASKAGIKLESVPLTQEDHHKDRLKEILSLSKEFYHYLLTSHEVGQTARDYITKRGVTNDTIRLFGLGVAPDAWDSLLHYLVGKKGFNQDDVVDAGLAIRSEKGHYYDRFRHRLMFPLTDKRGQVVGFSGRLLDNSAKEAKYINSPETQLYHKSELLFGYSQLSTAIRQSEEVVVCEGEFDVISSFQAHVNNVVAIKGSALSLTQIQLLSHSVRRICLALDADSAGIEATKRAIQLVKESDVDVNLRVIPVTGGKDPDEIARSSPAKWREMVQKNISVYEYLIDVSFAANDVKSGDGKKEITKELVPLLSQIQNAVEQAHYVQQVARRLGVSEEIFEKELRKAKLPPTFSKPDGSKKLEEVSKPKNRSEVLQRYLFLVLLASDGADFPSRLEQLRQNGTFSGVYAKLLSVSVASSVTDPLSFTQALPEELKEFFTSLYLEASELGTQADLKSEFENALLELTEIVKKEDKIKLAKEVGLLESKENLTPQEEMHLKELTVKMKELS